MLETLSHHFPGYEDWSPIVIGLLVVAYLAPLIIAVARKHRFAMAIGLLNVLLGWSPEAGAAATAAVAVAIFLAKEAGRAMDRFDPDLSHIDMEIFLLPV